MVKDNAARLQSRWTSRKIKARNPTTTDETSTGRNPDDKSTSEILNASKARIG